jgi:hypothetical protein
MPRFQRRLDTDTGYSDGHVFIPMNTNFATTGATPPTPAASYNTVTNIYVTSLATPAQAYTFSVPMNEYLMQRYGVQDDLQEQFGSGQPIGAQGLQVGQPTTLSTGSSLAGSNISVAVLSSVGFVAGTWCTVDLAGSQEIALINSIPDATHIQFQTLKNAHTTPFIITSNIFTTPAGVSGSPPYTGVTQLTSVTAPRPKGILFKQITPVYSILTAAATVNTIGIIGTTFANAAALAAQNTVLAVAANGLQTATNAAGQFYVTPIPIPVAKQVFQTARNTEFTLNWNVTTGAAATAAIVGVYVDVVYNFN